MKILLAVDGSNGSMHAVRHAMGLLDAGLRAELVLANVQEPVSLYEMALAHDPEQLRNLRAAAGADLLAPAETLLSAAGVGFESEVAGGDPAQRIVEMAENHRCDLIAIGAHSDGDPDRHGLGAVALSVLNHAAVAVLVVRPPPAAEPEPAGDAG